MLQPLRGKLHIEVLPEHKRTLSGLYLASNIEEIPHRGRVITLGLPIKDDKPWQFKVGEIVHFKRQWDNLVKHGIIKLEDIIAVENGDIISVIGENIMVKRHYTGKIGDSQVIFIPDVHGIRSNEESFYGEVMAVGIDSKFGLNKGDKIHYNRNEGLKVYFNEEELFVLKPRAILARME